MSVKKVGLVLVEIAMAIFFAASAEAQGPDESSEGQRYRYLPKSQPSLLTNSQVTSKTPAHFESCAELIATVIVSVSFWPWIENTPVDSS